MTVAVRFRHCKCSLVAALVALLCAPAPVAAGAGESGMAFLKLGVSGRGVALGDAMAAAATGPTATHYNPAGLVRLAAADADAEVLLMHKEWVQSTRTEFLGVAVKMGDHNALGFSLNTTTVSDIEIRTKPGPSEGTFTTRNLALGASFATALTSTFRAGLTARFLYEQILVDNASGVGVDLGMQYDTPWEGLSAGLALANIGSMSTLRSESSRLPLLARAGAAYTVDLPGLQGVAMAAADVEQLFRESLTRANLGLELVYAATVALRAGYQAGSEGRGFSAGGGVRHGILSFDYAFSRLRAGLGNGHTIAVSILL